MKRFIILLFCICFILLPVGFWQLEYGSTVWGHRFIGASCFLGMFVLMPCFLYHRWKNKNVRDYMLTKDAIERMRDYNDSKKEKSHKS